MSTCWVYTTDTNCELNNCTWTTDQWGGSWCDMPGANCWVNDTNQTGCDEADACTWQSGEWCDMNKNYAEACFGKNTQTDCEGNGN